MANAFSAGITYTAINIAAGASTVIIANAAASTQVWVFGFSGGADITGTIQFEDEDAAKLTGLIPLVADTNITWPITPDREIPWIRCTTAKALHILTVSCTFDGVIITGIVGV